MRLDPNISQLTLSEGYKLGPITCFADCIPNCTFTWTKNSSTIIYGPTLERVVQTKDDGGTYTCIASRAGVAFDTRDIVINVRCKFVLNECITTIEKENKNKNTGGRGEAGAGCGWRRAGFKIG